MKYKDSIYGCDFNIVSNAKGFKVLGLESETLLDPLENGSVNAITYFLSGINIDLARKLKNGEAYLEFWIEAIDHTRPTVNRKLYPADVFERGLQTPSFQNQLRLGGVPGEAEHPMIKMYSEDSSSQANIYNNLARVCRIEPKNVSHYIVGYKCTPERTYFKIRTSTDNRIIVNNILVGRLPGFSIRTRGDFAEPNADGVVVATGIEVITIDYVANPANATSVARPTITAVDPVSAKELTMKLLPKTGTESLGFESVLSDGSKLLYDPSITGVTSIANMIIRRPNTQPNKELSFESIFDREMRSFL